jgi:hypothetical protein
MLIESYMEKILKECPTTVEEFAMRLASHWKVEVTVMGNSDSHGVITVKAKP